MFLRGILTTKIKIKQSKLCGYHQNEYTCTFRTVLNTYSRDFFCENSKFSIWPAKTFEEKGDYYQKNKILKKLLKL